MQKFSGVSAIVGCISRGRGVSKGDGRFQETCGQNQLQLNIEMTKELVVDFRKQRTSSNSDTADCYKYPGVQTDNKLDWPFLRVEVRSCYAEA